MFSYMPPVATGQSSPSLSAFKHFLYAAPEIANLIQILRIERDWHMTGDVYTSTAGRPTSVMATILNTVASLPNLRGLLLFTHGSGRWHNLPFKFEEGLLPNSISTLSIHHVEFESHEDLAQFLSYFHRLKHLEVGGLHSRSRRSEDFITNLPESYWQVGLESINLGESRGDVNQLLCDLIRHGHPPGALQSAKFHVKYNRPGVTWDDIAAMGRLHASVGPSLKYLQFHIPLSPVRVQNLDQDEAWKGAWVLLHMECCTNLQSLHVTGIEIFENWEAISNLLRAISSPSLSQITITIDIDMDEEDSAWLERLDWDHMRYSLYNLHALTKIIFELESSWAYNDVAIVAFKDAIIAHEIAAYKDAIIAELGDLAAEIVVVPTVPP